MASQTITKRKKADTVKVIDVSWYQKDLDYDEVVANGVEGVIIKISEGQTPEETYWSHLEQAKAHGLKWGVYCYGHAATECEALKEANEVLYLLNGENPPLGVWYDVEDEDMLNADHLTAVVATFLNYFADNMLMAGVYASLNVVENELDVDLLDDATPYWVAQYAGSCDFKEDFPDKRLVGWQYTDREYIGNTNVDLDEWYEG